MTNENSTELMRGRFAGCLLGGAVGDALGAPVEFMKRDAMLARFGDRGITDYAPAYGGIGTITDDTQMTLFTAEGLLRGWVRGQSKGITSYTATTANAYQRWLVTQGESSPCLVGSNDDMGWLFGHAELHSRRAPGNTCLSALRDMKRLGELAENNSKGCGGVMRVAPVGLFGFRAGLTADATFDLGTELSALTHGHPTGALTGGVLAALIWALLRDASLPDALEQAMTILASKTHHEETTAILNTAKTLAASDVPRPAAVARLGQGWIAEEALAISVYCALVADSFEDAVVLAVNHDGDSDSTGAIVGNILGAIHGSSVIPNSWLAGLELRNTIEEIADDLYDFKTWDIGEYSQDYVTQKRIWKRYPGT